MVEFAQWLQATPLSIAIQSISWIVPLVQAIHIVMIGVVLVSLLMICLRVFGRVHQDESFNIVWGRFAPWVWTGLAVMAATGLVMIIGEPVRQATATSFWLKMGLLAVALVCVLWLRRTLRGRTAPGFPGSAQIVAGAVIVILVALVFLGRAIAYDVEVWGAWT